MFFSPFSIAITSLGEARANLSAFRTFVRFVLVWIYRFPLPLGVWEGLRFVIVALPGLFSYLFRVPARHCRVFFIHFFITNASLILVGLICYIATLLLYCSFLFSLTGKMNLEIKLWKTLLKILQDLLDIDYASMYSFFICHEAG